MTFMTKVWALIALVVMLAFGGNVPNAFAKPPAEVRACVDQRFAEEPFKGTLEQKEAQARNLPANKPFGKSQIVLPEGGSLWNYCKTLSAAPAVADTKVADLEAANGALKREVKRLEGLAYETINARDRTSGFVSDGTAWKDRAAAYKGELDTGKDKEGSATSVVVLLAIATAAAVLFALWLSSKLRKAQVAQRKTKFELDLERSKKAAQPEVPTPPLGDADIEPPTTPAPKTEPEIPAFLKGLKK